MLHYLPILGALAGYVLLMASNPVRESLRDGLRAVQRYPALAGILGLCGFGYAVFATVLWWISQNIGPAAAERPVWHWAQEGTWWVLPADAIRAAGREAIWPALDSTAGLFNNLVSTFPLAALAAILLLVNWGGHQRTLWHALRRRCRRWALPAHLGILVCALAALVKPMLYLLPVVLPREVWLPWSALWLEWSPVLVWLAFLFEYIFGVGVQVYLLLLAYCWVRGLTFHPAALRAFAIRRFTFVLRWAAVVMVLSTVAIDLPLMLQYAPFGERWFAASPEAIDARTLLARSLLALIFLAGAGVQITLTLHNESLRQSWRDHLRFTLRHWWPLLWFILIGALHFYALHLLNLLGRHALGEGTGLAIAWRLLFPWLAGAVGAWLLASWVSVFKRSDVGRLTDREWVRF